MTESLQLAATYFEMADEATTDAVKHSWEETGWMVLLSWAEKQAPMARECWPDGSTKTGGAFTAHLTQPRSPFVAEFRKHKPGPQTNSRFHQDAHKAAIV